MNHFLAQKKLAAAFLLAFSFALFVPVASFARTGLVVCTGAQDAANPNNVDNKLPICNFSYFLVEMQHVINWLFIVAIPIAALLFAYGGVLYTIGTPAKRTQANNIFKTVGIGFAIMLVSWAAVYTVVGWLVGPGSFVTSFLGQ